MKVTKVSVAESVNTLSAMHTLTFPGDAAPDWRPDGLAWAVYEGEDPVAFLYAETPALEPEVLYFSRVGVMPGFRGKGLQRRLMKAMYKGARAAGIKTILSTTYFNPPSANNFVREQWMTYNPAYPWGADNTIYWRKDL